MTQTERDLKSELDALDTVEPAQYEPAWDQPQIAPQAEAVKSLGLENEVAAEVERGREENRRVAEGSFFSNMLDRAIDAVTDWRARANERYANFGPLDAVPGGAEGLDFIARNVSGGVAPSQIVTGADEFTKGRERGFYNTMSSFAGGVEQYGKSAGIDAVSEYAAERKKAFSEKAGKDYLKPRIEGLKDISKEKWFTDIVDYAVSGVGEGLGSSAPFFVAGAVGGLPGAGAVGYTTSLGEIREELISSGVTDESTIARYAYLTAIPHAILDQMTERGVVSSLSDEVKREVTKGIVSLVTRAAAKGAVKEGVTEAAQRVLELGAVAHANGGESPNKAAVDAVFADVAKGRESTILESGVKGALPGSAFGIGEAAGGAISKGQQAPAPALVQEARVITPSATADTRPVAPMMDGPAQSGAPSVKSEPQVFSEPELEAARKAIQDAAQGLPVETAPQVQPGEEAAPEPAPEAAAMPETEQQAAPEQPSAPPTDEELDLPAVFADIEDYLAENEIQVDEFTDKAVRDIAQAVYEGEDLGVAVDRALGLETAPAAEEAPEPAGPTPDVRQKFSEVLASTTPRSQWAQATGVDPETLNTLIDEAVADGRMEIRFGKPVRKAAARVAPVKPERPATRTMSRAEEMRVNAIKNSTARTYAQRLLEATAAAEVDAAITAMQRNKKVSKAVLKEVVRAYGGVRGAPSSTRAAYTMIRNIASSRAPAAEQAPVQTAAQSTAPTQQAAAPAPAPEPQERRISIITPDGSMEMTGTIDIVELDSLKAATGAMQPRDRSRKESDNQKRNIAANLDPQQLLPSRVSDTGAPLAAADGTVISGNGRVGALDIVYTDPALADKAAAYRQAIGAPAGMKKPVMVVRMSPRATPEELTRFADLSNRSRIASLSATERAMRDARAAGMDIMGLYTGGAFTSVENREFFRAFTQLIPPNELNAFSKNGVLTKEGDDRLSASVLAAAYGDPDMLSRMLEDADDDIRSITGAMRDAAGAFIRLKSAIRNGQASIKFDITPQVAEVAKRIADLRARNIKPRAFLDQQDAFNQIDPIVESLLVAFYNDNLSRQLRREKITEILVRYADEAAKHNEGGLFEDTTTPREIVTTARTRALEGERLAATQQDFFAPSPSPAGRSDAGTSGTGSGQASNGRGANTDRQAATAGDVDAPSRNTNLERDWRDGPPQDGLGQADVPATAGADVTGTEPGREAAGAEGQTDRGVGVPDDEEGPSASVAGARSFSEAAIPPDAGAEARALDVPSRLRGHVRNLFASGLDRSALEQAIATIGTDRGLIAKDWVSVAEAYTGMAVEGESAADALKAIRRSFAERVHDVSLAELGGFDPAVSGSNLDWRDEVKAKIETMAKRLPEGVDVAIRDAITIAVGKATLSSRYGLSIEGGMFSPAQAARHLNADTKSAKKILAVSLAYGPDVAMQTFTHEEIHALRGFGLFTDKEWSTLSKLATRKPRKNEALRLIGLVEANNKVSSATAQELRSRAGDVTYREIYDIDERYNRLNIDEEKLIEEVVAHAAADWADGHDFGTRVERLMMKIRDFIEALGNFLRGNGFESVDSIFRSVWSGEVAKRSAAAADAGMGPPIEGYPVVASQRMDAASFAGLHASNKSFKRFDDARVGTGVDAGRKDKTGLYGHGHYITLSPEKADLYKEHFGPNGLVYQVDITRNPDEFLNWHMPLAQQGALGDKVAEAIAARGFMSKNEALRISRGEEVLLALGSGSSKHYKAAGAEALKSLGIAGIAYTDTIDNNKSRHWDFVVFNGDDIRITHVNGDATPETLDAYGAMFSIAAWHGTPHKVDRFDREKMGTGEGAQAFGKGLYFAENKAIAEWYKERLAAREAFRRGSYDHPVKLDYLNWSPKEHALDYLYKAFVKFGRDQHKEAALQEAEKWARHYEETRDTLWNRLFKSDELENAKYWAKKHRDAAALIRSGKAVLPQEILNREGNLYKVEINADPDHFYDLNKSPSEQSLYVKRVLREYIKKKSALGDRVYRAFNANGENVVINENRDFKYLGTQEEATKAAGVGGLADVDWSLIGSVKGKEKELEDAGIAGFSYFDASSRAQRDGTRNYVVFDDGKIRIVEENGAPVTADDAMFSLAGNAGGNSNRVKAWHSTPAKFDKFDNRFTDEVGFHFGSKNQAHDRAYIMSGGNLWKYFRNWRDIPVEMDIKNPVRISEDPGSFMPTSLAKQLVKDKIAPFEIIAQVQDAQLGPLGSPERAKEIVRNFLISKGYDAIVYPNQYEGIGDSYMTFGTGNVRHAVTGDVLYSLAGDGDGATATLNQAIDSLKSALGIQVTQNLFGVTIKAGKRSVRINPRSNILGQTSRATGGVGVRRSRDIRAIAHEGGHSLELMLGTSLDSIKAKFADSLVAPFAPDSPMPKLAPAGYSGLELDDVEQRALVDAVKANEELLRLSAVVGNAKSAPRLIGKPKYDEEAYRKAETQAGVARAQLIRLIGKPRADALMDEVRNKAPADATQFVAERFSPMGAPKRRKTATPDGEALSEGFARWFEKYVMSREAAFDMASDFFEAFEDLLEAEAPSVLEGLHTVQSQYKDWTKRATVEEMSSDMVSVASQNDWNALAEGRRTIKDTISGWAADSYTGIIDDLSPVQQIVRRLLAVADRNGVKDDQGRPISLKVAENPYKIARMFRGSYATGYSWIQDGIPNHGEEKVVFPGLQRALETVFGGARWDEATYRAFGQYLTSKRAIAEYDRLANKKKRLADIESILKQGANVWRNLRNEQDKDNEKLDRRNARLTRLTAIRDDRTKALRRAKADEKDIQKRMQGLRDDLAEAMRAIDDGSDVAKTVRDRKRRSLQVAERNARDARNMVVDLEQDLQDIDMEWTFLGNEVVNLRRAVEARQPQIDAVETSINLLKKEREATAKRGASRPPTLESREWHEEYIGKVESNKKYAKFAEAAQSVYAFTQGLLTVRYQAGLISDDLYRELSSRKGWYVPFMRDMTDAAPESVFSGNGGGKTWSPFKKFDGSDRAIINPLEILSQEAYAAAQHIAMNEAVGALAALAQKAGPGSAQIAELMERTEDIENTPDTWNRIRDIAISMGIDEADATLMAQRMEMNFANEDLQAIWSPSVKGPIAKPSLPLWDKGTRKHVVLHDQEFGNDALQAMMGMGKEQMNWLRELVGKPARVLQVGVTTHPTFMPRNLVRDVFDAWIKTGALPIITQVRGARALVEKDGEFLRQYTAAGGILGGRNIAALTSKEQQADVLEMDPNKIRHGSAALGAMALGITGTIMGGPLGGLAGSIIGYAGARHGGLLKMVEAVESMTRLGVAAHAYKRAMEHNPNLTQAEAMLEAAFVARDVFDWNRRGSKSLALVRTITFLNAQIQGLDKAARSVGGAGDRGSAVAKRLLTVYRREHDVPLSADEQRDLGEAYKVFGRLALYTAFLIGLYAMYRDDDRYEDIKSATKATHSWMPGFLGVDVRLPKAFEWAMPANFIEALWDKMAGRDPDFGARMSKSVQEVMVPPGVPQGLNLLVGWTTNTDMQSIAPWMFGESADKVNRKIVSDELKKLAPEAQFDAFTSQLSKDIAIAMAKAGLPEEAIPSPKMIDFTMRTGGYWGTDIQKAYQYTKESLGLPAGPQPRVPDMPLIGGFTGIAARQSKSLEEVYKLMSQQGGDFTTAAATYKNMMDKAGDQAGAEAFLNRLEPEARAYAILAYNFPASDKRRHPLERASAMAKITRDIRKEIVLERLAPTKKEGRKSVYDFENRIDLPPPVKTQVTDIMERLAQAESWNGFVALGRPGWEGKQEMATKPIMEELKAAAPDVYALFMDRVDKAKIEDYETIKKEWPKMRDELLRNGADANF